MGWRKSPQPLIDLFERVVPHAGGIERRRMFGYPAAFLAGHLFAGLHQESLILRLSESDRERARGARRTPLRADAGAKDARIRGPARIAPRAAGRARCLDRPIDRLRPVAATEDTPRSPTRQSNARSARPNDTKENAMTTHPVISREEWIEARRQHLAREKELTRLRDQVSQERRALPWVRVSEPYVFDGPDGKESLADLFEGRSQLIVQHFMFDPSWDEGCKSCSFWVDNFDGIVVHLNHRDVSFALVSRAPIATLQAYRRRMGWRVKWVSSLHTTFNRDYHVSFTAEERETRQAYYNYATGSFPAPEAPGVSVFHKDGDGAIYHTYSCYSRGLDTLNGTYQLLDLVPKGRDEAGLSYTMEWLRHHDRYDERPVIPVRGLSRPDAAR